jgi:Mlc titration factor MtfA (ptsG expression regulator)
MPDNFRDVLQDYIKFYRGLSEEDKIKFEERLQRFLSMVKITGVNAEVEELDIILIGAGAIIPVFYIPDWEYINLREILVYPGNFNKDFDQHGMDRSISGMVGTGPLQNVMILSKWELRQGFIHGQSTRNTAIHEFIHLIDKMDGSIDGVPEILLERKLVPRWILLMNTEIERIRKGESDIDFYAATSPVEFFAVAAEYFFEQPEKFRFYHPELNEMLEKIFIKKSN